VVPSASDEVLSLSYEYIINKSYSLRLLPPILLFHTFPEFVKYYPLCVWNNEREFKEIALLEVVEEYDIEEINGVIDDTNVLQRLDLVDKCPFTPFLGA